MKTQVVTVTNRIPDRNKESYYYFDLFLSSLRRFDAGPVILGMKEAWGGLMTKPRRLRQWLRKGGCTAEFLIVSDSFDVIFTAHPDAVAARWGGGDEIMFNAEKGLFPRGDLAYAFPERGTPWRYLNSGLFIGKPDNILALLEVMTLDDICDDHKAEDDLHGETGKWVHPNDQGWYQFTYAAHPVPMTLDTNCDCFQTLSACQLDEFEISATGLRNLKTGTSPLVMHANGDSKNHILPTLLERWGLYA